MEAFVTGAQFLLVLLLFSGAWYGLNETILKGKTLRKEQTKNVVEENRRRTLLQNIRSYRTSQSAIYLVLFALVALGHFSGNPDLLARHMLGLLLFCILGACVSWSLMLTLIPDLEGLVLSQNESSTLVVFLLSVFLFQFGGIFHFDSYYELLIFYNLSFLLEDVSFMAYYPLLANASLLHMTKHLKQQPQILDSTPAFMGVLLSYCMLGFAVPAIARVTMNFISQMQRLSTEVYRPICFILHGAFFLDQALRVPVIVEPLQDIGKSMPVVGVITQTLLAAPMEGSQYGYGPSSGLFTFVSTMSVVVTAVSSFIMDISDSSISVRTATPLVKSVLHSKELVPFVLYLRSLAYPRKLAMCGVVSVGLLQLGSVLYILRQLISAMLFDDVASNTPAVLLFIIIGLCLEVWGVLYIISPTLAVNKPDGESSGNYRSYESITQARLHETQGNLEADSELNPWRLSQGPGSVGNSTNNSSNFQPPGHEDSGNLRGRSSSASGRGSAKPQLHERKTNILSTMDEEDPDDSSSTGGYGVRIEALLHFKAFMQSLDEQPGAYSLDEFIKGAATAIENIFPGVHHASFCLLKPCLSAINIYTFLGDGAHKPPRLNIAVAPGTLIFHVLQNCQPVFIHDIITFPGPYSDVQFMRFVLGLKAVACLPLVVANSRILGVLRLGFAHSFSWAEIEKGLAKQLALVLSSSSHGMNNPDPRPRSLVDEDELREVYLTLQAQNSYGNSSHDGSDVMDMQGDPYQSGSVGSINYSPVGSPGLWKQQIPGQLSGGVPRPKQAEINSMRMQEQSQQQQQQQQQLFQERQAQMQAYSKYMNRVGEGGLGDSMGGGYNNNLRHLQDSNVDFGGSYFLSVSNNNDFGHHDSQFSRHHGLSSGSSSQFDSDRMYGRKQQQVDDVPMARGGGGHRPSNTTDIKMFEVIGRGGFGSVYKAFWHGKIVAVKVLEHGDEFMGGCSNGSGSNESRQQDSSKRRAALLEGAMSSSISHANVVQTFDYRVVDLAPQTQNQGSPMHGVLQETYIIMEWCDRGSIQEAMEKGMFLKQESESTSGAANGPGSSGKDSNSPQKKEQREVDLELVLMTLIEICQAMEYLHETRITHRDLKPKNILLKSSNIDRRGFTAKVSDFGLSQVLPEHTMTQVSTKYGGTVTHMPPELIEDGKVYQQGDVYAFGIIMWEIFTGASPFPGMAHPQIMVAVVTHNLRPKFPDTCPEWYTALAHQCWRREPKSRPPFSLLSSYLKSLLEEKLYLPGAPYKPLQEVVPRETKPAQ